MAIYCTRTDIELTYGAANVKKWADLDNRNNATSIADRIDYMCEVASAKLDSYLGGGPYVVPFDDPYPVLIVDLAARLAGYLLYQGRAADDEDQGQLDFASIKKEVLADIQRIRGGQMRLAGLDDVGRIPTIVVDEKPYKPSVI